MRSLETPAGPETDGDHRISSGNLGDGGGGGVGIASTAACVDVETLPDVPGEVYLISCKVQERRLVLSYL